MCTSVMAQTCINIMIKMDNTGFVLLHVPKHNKYDYRCSCSFVLVHLIKSLSVSFSESRFQFCSIGYWWWVYPLVYIWITDCPLNSRI